MALINAERFFRSGIKRLFSGTPWESLNELMQNAQRSGATWVGFSFPAPDTCVVEDNGHGLVHGEEDMRRLLEFSTSGFADPAVEQNQEPFGMGLYALIVNERITGITFWSFSLLERAFLAFALDTRRWLNDREYRETWVQRVQRHHAPREGERGFRLTLTGTPQFIEEVRACLLDTAAGRRVRGCGVDDSCWIQNSMSPACGYADLLQVIVDGETIDTSLPLTVLIQEPQIVDAYQGNEIRISLFSAPSTFLPVRRGWANLAVNWYGQLVFGGDQQRRGWHAYLHVRRGRPVHPRAPTRAGLIDDPALRSLSHWIEDRIFAWVCEQGQPEVRFVERLYAIDRERAERECPFAVIQQWKPLPADQVFGSYEEYLEGEDCREDEGESARLGPKVVVRKSDLETIQVLSGTVVCPLPCDHPAHPPSVSWNVERDPALAASAFLARFTVGLTSLLRATGLVAYKACAGVPPERINMFWWQPGTMVDSLHTTTPGTWGIQTCPTSEDESACLARISWNPFSTDALPVFVAGDTTSYHVEGCRWIIAVGSTDQMAAFLEQYAWIAFVPDEDEDAESIECFERSVKALIRSYLGNTIARDVELVNLAQTVQAFLPAHYDAKTATWRLLYDQSRLTGVELTLSDGYHQIIQCYS